MRKILTLSVTLVFLLAVTSVSADALPRPRIFEITPLSAMPEEMISLKGENLAPLGVATNGLYVWLINSEGGVNWVDYPYVQRMGGSWEDVLIRFPLPENLSQGVYKITVLTGSIHSGVTPFYYAVGLTTTTSFTTWHGGSYIGQRLSLGWCRESQTGKRVEFLSVIPDSMVFPGMIPVSCADGSCNYTGYFVENPPGHECQYVWGYPTKTGRYFVSTTFIEPSTGFAQTIVDEIVVKQVIFLPFVMR